MKSTLSHATVTKCIVHNLSIRRALFILCVAVSALPARAGLWEAVCAVESGGNRLAIGDGGKAAGIAQIHPIMVREANRLAGGRAFFTLEDRLDPVKSKAIFTIYTEHYAKGRSDEVRARIWNGGPNAMKATGKKLANLNAYYAKIKKHLKNE